MSGGFLKDTKQLVRDNDNEEGSVKNVVELVSIRIKNFNKLIKDYNIYKSKVNLLLDTRNNNDDFLAFCDEIGMDYIDFAKTFENAKKIANFNL